MKISSEPKQVFDSLARKWRKDSAHCSLARDKVVHPAYLEIIGLGTKIIPLIIGRLENNENHWFPALRAIVRENPVPNGSSFAEAIKIWKKWWKENSGKHGLDSPVA